MARIDIGRYAEDKACATPEGLKRKLMSDLSGKLETIDLQRNRVLVATYIRPNVSPGGVILTNKTSEEDRWQGKVGLVIACGPSAFFFDEVTAHAETLDAADGHSAIGMAMAEFGIPKIGDWVAYRTSETHEIGIEVERGVFASCRIIYDDSIIMRLDDPSTIW